MNCEHYWRDGILLVERGELDHHRGICAICRREHKAREELVRALPLVGRATAGEPGWEARVWTRISRLETAKSRKWWWYLGTGFTTACAIVLMWWALGSRGQEALRPRIEIVPGEIAMRSTSPRVGDRIQIAVKPTNEVRIYRADELVLRCLAGSTDDGCISDARGMVVEAPLTTAGDYRIVVITSPTAEPVGRLDRDLSTIILAGGDYQITELSIH